LLAGEEEPEYFGRGGPNGDGCGQKHLEEKYPTVKAEASAEGAAILEKYIKLQEAEVNIYRDKMTSCRLITLCTKNREDLIKEWENTRRLRFPWSFTC